MKKFILFVATIACSFAGNNVFGQACPNGDFENWTSRAFETPDSGWYDSNPQSLGRKDSLTVWKVPGYSGQAVHIQTAIIAGDTLQAYIVNTPGDPQAGKGGVPYSQQPTAITGYYRYNLPGNDSAGIWIIFKKAGAIISNDIIKFRGTGSVSTFTAFSFPLSALSMTPDTVIIAATCSNLFTNIGIESGSWLELDQLKFTGPSVTQNIPGGSFDNWLPTTFDKPDNWNIQENGNGMGAVVKSTTHYSGNYSVKLTSMPGGGGSNVSPSSITTGYFAPNYGPRGGLPYTTMTDTLTGYYMYTPVGTDTASIGINLSHTGSPVGGAWHNLFAASSWTYFEVPFSAFSTPDTIRIDVVSSSWTAATPGSVLYLDRMQLKSQPLPAVKILGYAADKVSAYPNPAGDLLNIDLGNYAGKTVTVSICDLTGRVIETMSYDNAPIRTVIPVNELSHGMYIYEIKGSDMITRNKFIKQ